MVRGKTKFFSLVYWTLLFNFLLCGTSGCLNQEYIELVEKWKKLKLGDTEEQVVEMLGPPSHSSMSGVTDETQKVLFYPGPRSKSITPEIYLNLQTLTVESIYCDEGYSIIRP